MTFKIGIITPTYNRPDLLERLHRSITASPADVDWCHYVVDDGSVAGYADTFARCQELSGRLQTDRIVNSGPLIARNRAIDIATADGCTHLSFIDDDDELMPIALEHIKKRIGEFPSVEWFMFPSLNNELHRGEWPVEPVTVSWFDDVVIKRSFGSDNFLVISVDLIGTSRFSERGFNQREWTFFLGISKKNDNVLVCPEPLRCIHYQAGGLTEQARREIASPEQLSNNVERAIRYWMMRPRALVLMVNTAKQLVIAPLKLLLYYFWR